MSCDAFARRHLGGHAFTIEDNLALMRWAALVSPRGYRVVVSPGYAGCEEVIEVYVDPIPLPAFILQQTASGVVLVDRLGMTLGFATLTDVLLAMVPLERPGRREVLRAGTPPWMPVISGRATWKTTAAWSRAWGIIRRTWPGSRRGQQLR